MMAVEALGLVLGCTYEQKGIGKKNPTAASLSRDDVQITLADHQTSLLPAGNAGNTPHEDSLQQEAEPDL